MSEQQQGFTAGPWQVISGQEGHDDVWISDGTDTFNEICRIDMGWGKEVGIANARLIASAPETRSRLDALISAAEALMVWVECLNDPYRPCPVCGAGIVEKHVGGCAIPMMRNALSAAKGETT